VSPRSALVLVALAAALGAFVYFYEIRGAEQRLEAEARQKQLFPEVEADAIEALVFRTQDDREVRLERRDGSWRVVEPLDYPADDVAIDGLASGLADLASEGVIETPEEPAVYGLGEDARVVAFEVEGRSLELRVGRRTPVGGMTYVSTGVAPERVYTVPTYRVTGFDKPLDDLREKRVLSFDRATVTEVAADWPGGGVRLERGEDDAWRLVSPLEAEADSATVDSLLSDLSFLRASTFLDAPDEAARRAVGQVEFHVVLTTAPEDGEGGTLELTVGGLHDAGRIVSSSQQSILYAVPPERLDDFPRTPGAYRFKEVTRFSSLEAQKLELAFSVEREDRVEEVVVTAVRGDEGWSSEPETMQPGMISRLVSELSRLNAENVIDPEGEATLAGLGLAPPHAVLRVFGAGEEGTEPPRLAEVALGVPDPERGIPARRPDRDEVFFLPFSLAEHLPVSYEAFQNRFLTEEEPTAADAPQAGEDAPEAEGAP
jgi:hypothetical protein